MASKRKRNQRITAILGSAIGLILVFTFVLSLLNLDVSSNSNAGSDDLLFSTVTPVGDPTVVVPPTPEPDPQLDGRAPYVHSSGYFQTFLPAGNDWYVDESSSSSDAALVRVVVQSGARLSLFHNFIVPGVEYDTLESLSMGYLTSEYFAEAWNAYMGWSETARQITEDRVIVDFELEADGNIYLARAVHVLREGWLYVTRIVVPENNLLLLSRLDSWISAAFQPLAQAQNLPVEWPTYVDHEQGYGLKHPPSWTMVAGGAGRPVTFNAPEGEAPSTIRVWAEADPALSSIDEARAWAEQAETVVFVLDVVSFERAESTGYEVAYSYRDTAGDPHSGLMVLVNNGNLLLVANVQIDPPDVNMLDENTLSGVALEARQAVTDGFFLLP